MTSPASVLTLFRAHMEAALYGAALLIIVACIWGANMAGKHTQAAIDAVAQYETVRDSATARYTVLTHERDSLAKANDDKAEAIQQMHDRNVTLAQDAADRKAASVAVRDRLTLHGDTAIVKTDSGSQSYMIPLAVTQQIATERLANIAALSAMEASRDSTRAEAEALIREVDGLHDEIQIDSAERVQLLANVAAAQQEIEVLQKSHAPRFSAGSAVAGALAVVAVRVGIALLTHH